MSSLIAANAIFPSHSVHWFRMSIAFACLACTYHVSQQHLNADIASEMPNGFLIANRITRRWYGCLGLARVFHAYCTSLDLSDIRPPGQRRMVKQQNLSAAHYSFSVRRRFDFWSIQSCRKILQFKGIKHVLRMVLIWVGFARALRSISNPEGVQTKQAFRIKCHAWPVFCFLLKP